MSGSVQNHCALDFCPGYSGGKYTGSCIIPINKAPKIFKDSPFNFTPTQIAKQLEGGDNARRICTIHVKDDNEDTFLVLVGVSHSSPVHISSSLINEYGSTVRYRSTFRNIAI